MNSVLSVLDSLTTIIGLPVAAAALWFGALGIRSADSAARVANATSALQNYLQLRADNWNLDNFIEGEDPPLDEEKIRRYGWIGLHALHTAEQIYDSMRNDRRWEEGWETTAAEIVRSNEKFITHPYFTQTLGPEETPWFTWDYYDDSFEAFVRRSLAGAEG